MKFATTPRKLIKAAKENLSNNISVFVDEDKAKNAIKALIKFDNKMNVFHKNLMEASIFHGCYPRIVDGVFYLEKYICSQTSTINGYTHGITP
jgi:hypothetical protein